nr:hypothetical protein HK105_005280 [Polyrhizophydium stewartii]
MNGLDWHQAVKDVKIAIEYLRTRGVKKVGIVGFCMGGALAIAAGVHVPELSAGICFYGIPPAAFASPADLKPPMQFHFGSRDKSAGFSDLTAAENLKKAVADAGKDVSEFYIWDADHAFMNEEAPAYPYNEPVAKQAFAKSVDFFKKHLA